MHVNDQSARLTKEMERPHAMQPDRKSVLTGVLNTVVVVRMRSTLPSAIAVGRSLRVGVYLRYTWVPLLR